MNVCGYAIFKVGNVLPKISGSTWKVLHWKFPALETGVDGGDAFPSDRPLGLWRLR
jgi:hypothetical protein